jgi:DNA invertase Pin-like site-specific DNA recombinase
MTLEKWQAIVAQKAKRDQERRDLEQNFNAEIVRRHRLGQSKEEIVTGLGISRELFNRVLRTEQAPSPRSPR